MAWPMTCTRCATSEVPLAIFSKALVAPAAACTLCVACWSIDFMVSTVRAIWV